MAPSGYYVDVAGVIHKIKDYLPDHIVTSTNGCPKIDDRKKHL
jgi:hypothetical protein